MTMPEVRHASVNSTHISVSLQQSIDPSVHLSAKYAMFSSRRVHRFLSFNLALQLPSRTPSSRSSWSGLPVLPSPWQSSRHSCWCGTGAWWPTCRRSGRHTRYSTRDPPVHNPSSAWPAPTLGWRTLARRTTLPWMPTAIRECISRGLAFSIDSRERSTG